MSEEPRCRWNGSDQPRILPGRHDDDCRGDCTGCQPCERSHCGVCTYEHAAGVCAECMALTREALRDIARMCNALPTEVAHRGVEGEAMVLLGPAADPEEWGHVTASYRSGRLPEGWIEAAHGKDCPLLANEACAGCAGGELHPLFVLGTWDMLWRDVLEHEESGRLTIASATAYLDMQMTYMSSNEDVPFEDFARDLRGCRAHLESVLHDGEQIDQGAPCMDCRVPLVREWGKLATADGWRCPRCREWRSDADYRLNVAQVHRDEAEWLTDRECEIRTGVRAGTVREWARKREDRDPLVAKRQDSGRVVYLVADIERVAREKGMMSA